MFSLALLIVIGVAFGMGIAILAICLKQFRNEK